MAAIVRFSRNLWHTSGCVCSQLPNIGSHRSNSNRASITKIKKAHYVRTYPTCLVLPDGSSITIRYETPRKILKLPVDMDTLTEEEKRRRKLALKPPQKIVPEKKVENTFDISSYKNMVKKKKK